MSAARPGRDNWPPPEPRLLPARPAPAVPSPDGALLAGARAAIAHLRAEADFNRSWTDGRRAPQRGDDAVAYRARRLALARERDGWADAIEALIQRLRADGRPAA